MYMAKSSQALEERNNTQSAQVSFGHYDTEEEAARQYDRALIIEKGRGAKSNFPLADYEQEMAAFKELVDKK